MPSCSTAYLKTFFFSPAAKCRLHAGTSLISLRSRGYCAAPSSDAPQGSKHATNDDQHPHQPATPFKSFRPSVCDREDMWSKYQRARLAAKETLEPSRIEPHDIFTNNELALKEIDVYGFDYDYTLAVYKKDLNTLIYELALRQLIDDHKYPAVLAELPYDPEFAIRGLHYDVERGILMKIDAYALIQNGTVYRGKRQLTNKQILDLYDGNYVPAHYFPSPDQHSNNQRMVQFLDLFSLPEAGLLTNIVQYFDDNKIDYDPASLFRDVRSAIQSVHTPGVMYSAVNNDLEKYVHNMPGLREFFERLISNKKIVFLITNSPFMFINTGLTYLIGKDWRDYFHFIVVKARKPKFFKDRKRPFRVYNMENDRLSYEKVTILKRDVIYAEGNLMEFLEKTGLGDSGVLFFGDHVYSDLAEPMLTLGWRTGAIVPELKREIQIQNSPAYAQKSKWLVTLTSLVESYEDCSALNADSQSVVSQWKNERETLRHELKIMFNPQFGSLFRTYHSPTYFSRRLTRLSDVYTARLTNFLGVGSRHTFYPTRYALPHETHFSVPSVGLD